MTAMDKISLNQKDAARALGVSSKTLQRWAKNGMLVPCKIGGRVTLYEVKQLEDFLRQHRQSQQEGQ